MEATIILKGSLEELREFLADGEDSGAEPVWSDAELASYFRNAAEGGKKFLKYLAHVKVLTIEEGKRVFDATWGTFAGITSSLTRHAEEIGKPEPPFERVYRRTDDSEERQRVWIMADRTADIIASVESAHDDWWE